MRPGSLESLRGLQMAIGESIMPQLTSAFGQDTATTLNMLVESLAAEWDGLAEELSEDNTRMRDLLTSAVSDLRQFADGNETITRLVNNIEEPDGDSAASLKVSALSAENDRLRGKLEALIVALEDVEPDPEYASLKALRAAVYKHLRRGAGAGWSFWDVASFRERMATLKSEK
jgi:hypothetical protein